MHTTTLKAGGKTNNESKSMLWRHILAMSNAETMQEFAQADKYKVPQQKRQQNRNKWERASKIDKKENKRKIQ